MKLLRSLGIALAGIVFGLTSAGYAIGQWAPSRHIEIIAPATPGGGFDTQARTLQRLLQDNKLIQTPMTVVNRPGGGGTLGWTLLNQQPKDGHAVAVASTTLLTNDVIGVSDLKYTDVTPVAILATEYLVFSVKADSPIKTGADLIALLRKSPKSITFSTAPGPGNANHILIGAIAKAAGVDIKHVPIVFYKSAAESATALLGGHVDCVVGSIPPVLHHAEKGTLRIIALAAPKRHTGLLANVPTWLESGVDAIFVNWRGVVGPKSMTVDQIAFWEAALMKLTTTSDWDKTTERFFQVNEFHGSKAMREFLGKQYQQIRTSMIELGMVKQ